jgi:protein-S-isoprenylcysteine O-methyltransferase Ste14
MTTINANTISIETPSTIETFLARYRVHFGFLFAAGILADTVIDREKPLDLFHPTWMVAVAIPLIIAGTAVRFISLGTIFKNETLATKGIYSRCRHPLYFGSSLLFVGLGLILNDADHFFWYLGIPYILVFFGIAIRKEERFLRGKFGEEFDQYKKVTPAVLPLGRYSPGEFSAERSLKKGGIKLVVSVILMLVAMQAMVLIFPHLPKS